MITPRASETYLPSSPYNVDSTVDSLRQKMMWLVAW